MAGGFHSFVVFAEMRTGSNFLEANLNALDGVQCYGEAFNPHFIGYPNSDNILGLTRAQREARPEALLQVIRDAAGMCGFRYFHDHDPRVLDPILADEGCAKIVLTRNPVESYVSWKIAQATGQWKLTNVKHARAVEARFDSAEFEGQLNRLQAFQVHLLNALQRTGQTAFYVDYEDLQDLDVMNGLARWLGIDGRLTSLDRKLKKQNPAGLSDKVVNYEAMSRSLARLDRFNLARTPNFEPRRAPLVPSYIAAPQSPLLYLPVQMGPEAVVIEWLSRLDGGAAPQTGFTQKTLRGWKSDRPGFRAFTVLRHPLARAHAAYCEKILGTGSGTYPEIRTTLRKFFRLPIPQEVTDQNYDDARHKECFLGFLGFLKGNLNGQTSVRVDPTWASQTEVLRGFSSHAPLHMILREEGLEEQLAVLADQVGKQTMPALPKVLDPNAERLGRIHDGAMEQAARAAYGRDYTDLGFGNWR